MASKDDDFKEHLHLIHERIGSTFELLDKRLNKFDDKLDSIDSRIDSVDKTLVVQASQLKDHIRRTELNEEAIALQRDRHEKELSELHGRVAPLERHAHMWAGAGKVLAVIVAFATIIGAVVKVVWH